MLFVSGTKRSGTSMWMQVLRAAGLDVLGEAFPRGWKTRLSAANPDGFYESILRMGVYWRTNPHPTTGQYFLPEEVRGFAVKVFIPGVVRSERSYIDLLVANIRDWREYEASIERLAAIEAASWPAEAPTPVLFPPVYEWWMENFALARDIGIRRYPALLQTYDQVVTDPEPWIRRVLERIGAGDPEPAIAAVRPEHRTQRSEDRSHSGAIADADAQVFDDLYGAIETGGTVPSTLLDELNRTNRRLLPAITQMQRRVAESMRELARFRPPAPPPGGPQIPGLVIPEAREHPED